MKNFKAQVIGHKTGEEKIYTTSVDTKKKRYNELVSYLQEFISVENIKAFDITFRNTCRILKISMLTRRARPLESRLPTPPSSYFQ